MNKRQRWMLVGLALGNVLVLAALAVLWIVTSRYPASPPLTLIPTGYTPSPSPQPAFPAILSPTPLYNTPEVSLTDPMVTVTAFVELEIASTPVHASACPISVTGGLASELYAIVQAMPGPGTEGMIVPTTAQMAAWETLAAALAAGDARTACEVIDAQGFPYELVDFTDVRADNDRYWLLRERLPVTTGWGTVVIRAGEVFTDVVVEIPHPVADWLTDPEGVALFRALKARALLVAGTHRCANQAYSPCSGTTMACGPLEPYRVSDVGHATQALFQAAHQALAPCGSAVVTIQLHANSLSNCPDLFVSNGTLHPAGAATSLAEALAAACPDYTVDLADGLSDDPAGECGFYGGAAVQGVYANGCGTGQAFDACTMSVSQPFGPERFIHLEQSTAARQNYACVLAAFQSWWSQREP